MDYSTMKLMEVADLPGLSDLPLRVRGKLAQALQAEARGNYERATALLEQAADIADELMIQAKGGP